jgi:hypothetical protein
MASSINFTSSEGPQEVELTPEQCEHECTRDQGYLEIIGYDKPYTKDDIEECIATLKEQKMSTCGDKKESTQEKTNKVMSMLRKYGYTEFVLRRQRINDPASECELQGWEQGADDSDCWIDSFLFAVFGNNNLSSILIPKLHEKFHATETKGTEAEARMNDALFSMNLYLNLLTNRAKAIRQKGNIKWCIVWNILQYFRLTKTNEEYDIFLGKASLQEATLSIGKGGDPNLLSCFLSEIDPTYNSTPYNQSFTSLATMRNSIRPFYNAHSNSNLIGVSFQISDKTNTGSRYFPELLNLFTHKLFLEAIVLGQVGHATAFTFCNGNWRYYDNKAKPTTTMITRQDFGSKLNKLLINSLEIPTFVLLVYRVSNVRLGGTRKLKHKRRARAKTRRHR